MVSLYSYQIKEQEEFPIALNAPMYPLQILLSGAIDPDKTIYLKLNKGDGESSEQLLSPNKPVTSQVSSGFSIIVKERGSSLPTEYTLYQNYPNPFNPTTMIRYDLPENAHVILKVFNLLGQEVQTLVNEEKDAGSYKVQFDGSRLPSGVYFYKITAGKYTEQKKMIMVK